MAEEEMDVATPSDTEVSNHVETDGKFENHGKKRTAENEFVENDVKNDEQDKNSQVKDEENCVNSAISSEVSEKTEGGASKDGIATDVGTSEDDKINKTEGGSEVEKTATMECKGQSDEDVMTKESEMDKEAGMSTEGGIADEGIASEDASNAEKNGDESVKLSENPKSQPVAKERKTRLLKRCLRHREPRDKSDSSEERDHDAEDSSTRSPRSHESSNTDETESDMERDANDDEPAENDPDHDGKSATELCSDFEDELLAKPLPKPNWRAIPMLRARELGEQKSQTSFSSKSIGSVHLVSRFEKYCELKHHEGCVNTLHFNQSGRLLASGSDDLNIVLWDWAQQKTTLVYPSGHRSNVFQAKFMPFSGDTTLVSCARDGQVRVGELSSTGICKSTKKLVQHKGAAHKLGLEPDSPVVFLTCGEDAAVFNIDLRTSKATKLVTVKEEVRKVALYTIFVNPMDTNEFCVGGRDHFVRIYDRRKVSEESDRPLKKFCPHHLLNSENRANVTCCVYSYNGGEILASYNDEDIYLFDNTHSDGAEFVRSYKGHRNNQTVKGVNFYGPQSQFVVSGSDCGNIFLWEKNTEKIVQYMKGDNQGVVNCLESHPSSAVLATSGLDHDVKIWMPTAAEPTRLEGLKRTMFSNRREREEERREPDMIDGHMLMFLMQHLRRRARRQAREAGDLDSDTSTSDSDSSDDEDAEGGLPGERSQCAPS